jgi:hypothetical protein
LAVPWLLVSLALGLSPRHSLWAAATSGACLAIAVLTKETFLLFLPAVAWVLWEHCHRRTRAFCLTAFAAVLTLVLVAYPVYAVLKRELLPGPGHVSLWAAIRFQLVTRPSSGSVLTPGSRAWNTVDTWLRLDSLLLLLGLLSVPVSLLRRRLRPLAGGLLLPVIMMLAGGYLPDAYVVALLPFAALLIAGVIDWSWGHTAADRSGLSADDTTLLVRARRQIVGVLTLCLAALLVSRWRPGVASLLHGNRVAPAWAAERWPEANIDRRSRVVVDDSLWVDLVDHGFNPHLGVVWFYKLDFANNLDPSVAKALPGGWRDFEYIVSTPIIRSALDQLPTGLQPVRQTLVSSDVIVQFGAGPTAVEIRRIRQASAQPLASPLTHPLTPARPLLTRPSPSNGPAKQ